MHDDVRLVNMKELLLWGVRFRRRFRITGMSMTPLLKPGDEILIDPRAYRRHSPCVGDIVVARHPYRMDVRVIKRVAQVLNNDRYDLQGDNSIASTDSRSFGVVPRQHILGQVTSRFR
ncbi:nickel-type superoxide dismutase maturation protease [candidate division KSB3 bacterium]|uniref:Nickel-type superoxide dismutase maturation protease n=1 Tax=candidate division KSB3 bacterium TaxID=2044937 RepID=A0A2G6KI31_9BACT|nr:MAG: nickel-type superoxide dismutase maturation protease [candidate division KSB3 bacterium]